MSSDRFAEHYRLVSTDLEKRAELLADPKAALAAYFGAVVDGDYRIEVIEQRPDTITSLSSRHRPSGTRTSPRASPTSPGGSTTCSTPPGSPDTSSPTTHSPGCCGT